MYPQNRVCSCKNDSANAGDRCSNVLGHLAFEALTPQPGRATMGSGSTCDDDFQEKDGFLFWPRLDTAGNSWVCLDVDTEVSVKKINHACSANILRFV